MNTTIVVISVCCLLVIVVTCFFYFERKKHTVASENDGISNEQSKSSETESISELQEELEKAKKDLAIAEEQKEDAEDDSDDYKKKLDREKEKSRDLSSDLDNCKKSLKEIHDQFENQKNTLDEISEQFNHKKEALDFVNEILNADPVKAVDVEERNNKIDKIKNFVTDDLFEDDFLEKEMLNKSGEFSKKNASLEIQKWANFERKTWLKCKTVIAFVGEFSAGKTSIVNRILSQDDDDSPKLPVNSKATTAIATYIAQSNDFYSRFTSPEGVLKSISKESFQKVNKEIMETVDVSSLIECFVMGYDNPNLTDLSILDTPGFNSNDENDAKRTIKVINETDALFWVIDANAGDINKSSLDVISENVQDLPLFIVINKSDTKSPEELDSLEKHIKETIQKNNISVSGYIRFSMEEPVSTLMDVIKTVDRKPDPSEYLSRLYYSLLDIQNKLKIEYDSHFNKLKEVIQEKCDLENKFFDNVTDFGTCCDVVENVPELEKSFWLFRKAHYEITEDRYKKFKDKIEMMKENCKIMEPFKDELIDQQKKIDECQKNISTTKKNKKLVADLEFRFRKFLNDYDPSIVIRSNNN
jgi:GTPase SAR1 family protein